MIINYMEECVKNYLEKVIKQDENYAHICTCPQCMDDIMAKSLNNLKPYYITSKKGEVFATYNSLETQHSAEVITSVINAIEFVSKHRSHDLLSL